MVLDFTRLQSIGSVYFNPGINPPKNDPPKNNVRFYGNTEPDRFESTSPKRFTSEASLLRLINTNPKISTILSEMNAPVRLNMKELNELLDGHALDVQTVSAGIIENLPFSLKNKVDPKAISDAAYLHDLGKVLIPPEVLNKQGKLDDAETKIMHRHSELSYELLKNTNLDKKTLNLIRNHHQNAKRSGYPFVDNSFNADLNLQILSIADKYSALREKRVYKEPMSKKQALTIIYNDVKDGKLHPFVFNALVKYSDNSSLSGDKSLKRMEDAMIRQAQL